MSGAAARTGSFNNKQEEKAYKIVMAVEYLKSNTQRTIYKTWKLEVGYQDRKYEKKGTRYSIYGIYEALVVVCIIEVQEKQIVVEKITIIRGHRRTIQKIGV